MIKKFEDFDLVNEINLDSATKQSHKFKRALEDVRLSLLKKEKDKIKKIKKAAIEKVKKLILDSYDELAIGIYNMLEGENLEVLANHILSKTNIK